MSELAFVIAADRGTMIDEKTGEKINWSNCHYLTAYREDADEAVGFKPIKAPLTPECFDIIRKYGMGLYQLDFHTRPGALNKPTLTLVKAEQVGKIDLFELGNYRPKTQSMPGAGMQTPKV
ncbi:MAG: hypothetical protein HZB71_08905 [Betaproteobacteria bacterium]|nr:hypothetical protein [Betaproteobacteria bacterium]